MAVHIPPFPKHQLLALVFSLVKKPIYVDKCELGIVLANVYDAACIVALGMPSSNPPPGSFVLPRSVSNIPCFRDKSRPLRPTELAVEFPVGKAYYYRAAVGADEGVFALKEIIHQLFHFLH
jgi:hypothetical protein